MRFRSMIGLRSGLSALALSSIVSGAIWYVSPTVTGSGGAGTLGSPYSLEYAAAGAGGAIKSGDAVQLRGNADQSDTIRYKISATAQSRDGGFVLSQPGITLMPYPGERVVIQDDIDMSAGWTQIVNLAGKQIWESNFVVPGTVQIAFGSFLGADGKRHILANYRYNDETQINADSGTYRNDGSYYCGPGVTRMASGKLRVRLDPLLAGSMGAPAFPIQYPTSTNPALANLAFTRQDWFGLVVTGDGCSVIGIEVNHFFINVRDHAAGTAFVNCKFQLPYLGMTVGDGVTTRAAGTYVGCEFDGMLRGNTTFLAYGDIKNGNEPCVSNRNQAFTPNNTGINGKVWGCTFTDCFDGSVILSPGWEFGSYGPVALTGAARETAAWANANRWVGVWDDALQYTSRCQGMNVHHNFFLGAGTSPDGASSGVDQGFNWPTFHHNIYNNIGRTYLYNKSGRDQAASVGAYGDARYTEEGRCNMFALSSHGEPAGTSFRFHRNHYHNTIILAKDIGNGPQSALLSSWGNTATGVSGGRTMVFNNLIIDAGWWNANQPTSDEGRFRVYNNSRLYMQRGDNAFDGNAHIRVAPTGAGVSFLFTQIDSSGATAETLSATYGHALGWDYGYITGLPAFRAGPLLTDAQVTYAPGWEASGIHVGYTPATFSSGEHVNLMPSYGSPYTPFGAQLATGAAVITGLGLKDMPVHQPWRGALAPETIDTDAAAIVARMGAAPAGRYQYRMHVLITALKAAGVWTKLTGLRMYNGEGTTAELINWMSTSYPAALSNAPTFAPKLGFVGNGTTSELTTGHTAAVAFGQNDAHLGVYVATAGNSGGTAISTGNAAINPGTNATNCFMRLNNAGSASFNCPGTGHFIASRTAANLTTFYRNGAVLGTLATASAAPTGSIRVLSNQGSAYSTAQVTFDHCGAGLTTTEAAALSAAFAAYIATA